MKIRRPFFLIPVLLIILLVGIALTSGPISSTTSISVRTEKITATRNLSNNSAVFSLQDFSICTSNCTYPSPYISGEIFMNYSAPMYSLQVLVNGIGDSPRIFHNATSPQGGLFYLYKGTTAVHIVSNQTYVITAIIMFADNATYTASTNATAS